MSREGIGVNRNTNQDQGRNYNPRFYSTLLTAAAETRSKKKATRGAAIRAITSEMIKAGVNMPPVDVSLLASHLGIREIIVVPLPIRGRLMLCGRDLIIEINERLDDHSRRHTIAHEIAHLVLEKEQVALARAVGCDASRPWAYKLMEELCDLCADEILLPESWLSDQLGRKKSSLEGVLTIAALAQVPAEFVITRIIDLQLESWRAIWYSRNHGDGRITRTVPQWDDTFLASIDVCPSEESPLARCWETEAIVKGYVNLRIHGEDARFPAQCMKIDKDTAICILYTGPR